MKSLNLNKEVVIAALILSVVFILDIMLPVSIAVGVLYLLCFFIMSRQSKKTYIVFFVAIILLSLIKLVFFQPPASTFMIFVNRGISITVMSIVVFISYKRRRQFEYFYKERKAYDKELGEMLYMISHEVRKPITNCIGLMNLLESNKSYSQQELKEVVGYLKPSVYELDTFTRKLTFFVDDLKKKDPKTKS